MMHGTSNVCAFAVSLLIGGVVIAGQNQREPAPGGSATDERASLGPVIAVKETEPVWLVFTEYVGPYWRVGRSFAKVGEHMLNRSYSGPLFIRYQALPSGSLPASLRAEIGFMAMENPGSQPGFTVARQEAEPVVYAVVDGLSAATRREYARLHEWARVHGYNATGRVTEVYPSVSRADPAARQKVELQVSVARLAANTDSISTRLQAGSVEPKATAAVPAVEALVSGTIPVQGVSAESEPQGGEPEPGTGNQDTTCGENVCVAANPPSDSYTCDIERGAVTDTFETSEPKAEEPTSAIRELVAAGQFERVARRAIPDEGPSSDSHQIWLGQLVFRMGAVAKGIAQVYPGEDGAVSALADAMRKRYGAACANHKVDPLADAVVRVDLQGGRAGGQKRAIMSDLDRLLGRVAHRSVSAEGAVEALADILQRVEEVNRQAHADDTTEVSP